MISIPCERQEEHHLQLRVSSRVCATVIYHWRYKMAVVVFFLIRSLFIFSCMYIHTRERHDFFNGVLSLASYMYNKSYSASNSFISYTQEKKKKKQERNKTNTTHSRYLMARDENNQIKIKIVIVIVTLQSNQMRGIGGGNTHHGSIFIFESIGRKQHVDTKNTQYFIIYFFFKIWWRAG